MKIKILESTSLNESARFPSAAKYINKLGKKTIKLDSGDALNLYLDVYVAKDEFLAKWGSTPYTYFVTAKASANPDFEGPVTMQLSHGYFVGDGEFWDIIVQYGLVYKSVCYYGSQDEAIAAFDKIAALVAKCPLDSRDAAYDYGTDILAPKLKSMGFKPLR